jgi:hypothetical protein
MKLTQKDFHYWVDDILRELDGYDHPEVETNPTPNSADHERWTATKVSGPDDYRLFTLHLNQPQMQAVMDSLRWSVQNITTFEAKPCFCGVLGIEEVAGLWVCREHLLRVLDQMRAWAAEEPNPALEEL